MCVCRIYLSLWFWVDLALLLPWRPFSTMMTLPPPPHKVQVVGFFFLCQSSCR